MVMEFVLYSSRHSDINLVEVGTGVVKDEDTAVLLEGGSQQPASPKARSLTASSSFMRLVIHEALVFVCLNCSSILISLLK